MPLPSTWQPRHHHAFQRRLSSPHTTRTVAGAIVGILALSSGTIVARTPVTAVGGGEAGGAAPATAAPDPARAEAATGPTTDDGAPAAPIAAAPAPPEPAGSQPPAVADGDAPAEATAATPVHPTEPGTQDRSPDGGAATEPRPAPQRAPAREATTTAAEQPAPRDSARARFESSFPAHAGASEDRAAPATTRWAVLIGINEHAGRTRDNVASRQDAEDLARHLRSLGWRDDHVLLLTDAQATHENIVQALDWLARKTTAGSLAVVHYSGHTKQWPGRDVDGDGEVTDEALWPSDNRFLLDSELVRLLRRIPADRLWVNVGACEAAGFNDPGLEGPGRLLTFSSREDEKSYEDPSRGNSVWGYHLIEEGLVAGYGDLDGDGVVTIEEAFAFAAPRAAERTRGQSHGPQRPVMVDGADGGFDLRIPSPPSEPSPEPSEDDDRNCTLIVCPRHRSAAHDGR